MKTRRQKPEARRNDFLQMMMEAQAGQLKMEEKDFLDDHEKDVQLNAYKQQRFSSSIR